MTAEEPDQLSPDEAFELVASEARFDILQSLWDLTNGDEARDDPVSFSTLHDATDIRDSGQFNYHPAVVGFLYDHGVNLRETYLWDLDWLFEAHASTLEEDPLRVELTVSHEGESLRLTLDEDLEVIETDRC